MPEMLRNEPVKREARQEPLNNRKNYDPARRQKPGELRLADELRRVVEESVRKGKKLPKELFVPNRTVVQEAYVVVSSTPGNIDPGSALLTPRHFIQRTLKGIERLALEKRMDPVAFLRELFQPNVDPAQKQAQIVLFYQIGKEERSLAPSTAAGINVILSLPAGREKERSIVAVSSKLDQFLAALDVLYEQYRSRIEKGVKAEEDKEAARVVLVKRKIEEVLTIMASLHKAPQPA